MGQGVPKHEDRRYSHEEIQALVITANMKLKAAILIMSSSGVIIGSLRHHLKPNELMRNLQSTYV